MIVKSNNIPKRDAIAAGRYVLRKGDNELPPKVIIGDPHEQAYDAQALAEAADVKYSLRHVQINPTITLTELQIKAAIEKYIDTLDIDTEQHDISATIHTKQRSDDSKGGHHIHLLITHCSHTNLKTLNSSYTRMKNERVARELEIMFAAYGEEQVRGRWGKRVIHAIENDQTPGNELANIEMVSKLKAAGIHEGDIGRSSYRPGVAQRELKRGLNLPRFEQKLKAIFARNIGHRAALKQALDLCDVFNIVMMMGNKKGFIVFKHKDKIISSLDRLSKIPREQMKEIAADIIAANGATRIITNSVIEALPITERDITHDIEQEETTTYSDPSTWVTGVTMQDYLSNLNDEYGIEDDDVSDDPSLD